MHGYLINKTKALKTAAYRNPRGVRGNISATVLEPESPVMAAITVLPPPFLPPQ